MHKRFILLLFMTLAGVASVQGQAIVRGRVVSADSQAPVSGARIVVRGGTEGTTTDAEGRYSLSAPAGATLLVSAIGYETQQVAVQGRGTVDVSLRSAAVALEELVVVGYTTQARRNVTGAVATVQAEVLEQRKVATLEEALKGRVAGVNIISSGEPGRASRVIVRGQNFTTNPDPLYVVDGVYTRQNPNLNPEQIESLEVLKDASAAAQYGAQAANGVIVIRTRRGRAGEPRISFGTYYGFQEIPNRVEMADAQQWGRINTMARQNAGLAPFPAASSPAIDTDWQDALMQRGAIQNHNLSVSGGNESASYLVTGGYLEQDGTLLKTGFERYSFRVNSEIRRGILTIGENFSLARSSRDNLVGFPLIDAVRMQPSIPVRDPNNPSGYGYGSDANPTFGANPVGAIERQDNRDAFNHMLGNVYAELGLRDNLRYRLNLGATYQDLNWRQFIRERQIRQNTAPDPTQLTDRRDNGNSLLIENQLTFDDQFGAHEINTTAVFTEQREKFNRLEAFRRGFVSENLPQIDAGTTQFSNRGNEVQSALRSFLVRGNYAFADRYLLTGSWRRDGSSRFGPDNRYGDFWAASAGWVLSEEPFFSSIPVLGSAMDYLKLRASYGKLGNQDIGDYQYAASIEANRSYLLGNDAIALGSTQVSLANPGIRWQENTQMDIGVDLSLLDARLSFNADYYVSESGGLLVRAPLPWSLGSQDAPFVNAGSVRNRGLEFGASYRHEQGDFRLTTTANLTTIENEVLELGNGGQPIFRGPFAVARTEVGGPIGEFFVLRTDGLFQTAADVQAHRNSRGAVIQPTARPGDIRYADLNDDGIINDLDRYVAGDPNPDFEGGFFLDGGFKALDFGLSLRGSRGAEIFNVVKFWTDRMDEGANYRADLDPWSPENPNAKDPRPVWGTAGNNNARANTDRWIEDGSYLRIQNLVLGYRLPTGLTRGFGVGGDSRIYVNVQNVHTFTGYSNWDPEVLGFDDPLARGIDDGRIYPTPRTFTIGVDLDL